MQRVRPGRWVWFLLATLTFTASACDDERDSSPAEQPGPDAAQGDSDLGPPADLSPSEDLASDAEPELDQGAGADAEPLPEGCHLWVAEGAPAGGDGAPSRPLPTLAAALQLVEADCTLHLAKGLYRLPSRVAAPGRLIIEGASRAHTLLAGREAGAGAWFEGMGALELRRLTLQAYLDVQLRSVQIAQLSLGGPDSGLRISGADGLQVQSLSVAGGGGLHVESVKQLSLSAASFTGPAARLRLVDVSSAELSELSFTDVSGPALVLEQTRASLDGLLIERVADDPADAALGGDGVVVQGGGLALANAEIRQVADRGLVFDGAEGTVTALNASGSGRGLIMTLGGSQVHVQQSTLEDSGVLLYVSAAELVVDGSELRRGTTAGLLGGQGAVVRIVDSTFEDCPQGHISLLGEGSAGTIERCTFRNAAQATCLSFSNTAGELRVLDNTIQACAGGGVDALRVADLQVRGNAISDIRFDVLFGTVANGISFIDSMGSAADNDIFDSLGTGVSTLRSVILIESNRIGPVDSSGISVVDPSPEPTVVSQNTITAATGTGVVVLATLAEVRSNRIEDTVRDASSGLGDGVAFGMGGDVVVADNTCVGNIFNGVIFMDGARGQVQGNHLQDNGMFGVMEFCMQGLAPNEVTVSGNTFEGNRLGEVERCGP